MFLSTKYSKPDNPGAVKLLQAIFGPDVGIRGRTSFLYEEFSEGYNLLELVRLLPQPHCLVLRFRYGLARDEPADPCKTAEILGLSKADIDQCEAEGIERLRLFLNYFRDPMNFTGLEFDDEPKRR